MSLSKHIRLALLAPLVLGMMQAEADTVASASTTANASATIIQPITIASSSNLAFGTIVRPSSGSSTITVSNAGTRTVGTGGAVGLNSGTTPSSATFTVTGEGGQSISVTVPATITLSSGANQLTVTTTNNMTGSASSQTLSNSLGTAGTLDVKIGGSITVSSTTPSAAYSGTFTVSASYN